MLAAATAVAFAVAACSSGSGDTTLAVAQARVTAKEAALTAAKAEATAASATFCAATQTYVRALDCCVVGDVDRRSGQQSGLGAARSHADDCLQHSRLGTTRSAYRVCGMCERGLGSRCA